MNAHEPQGAPKGAGAMTVAMRAVVSATERRALRIAIVRGGKILHDRTLWEPGAISVGSAERSTFVVSGAGVPKHAVLFDIDAEGVTLRFAPNMGGRVMLGGVFEDLSVLATKRVDDDAPRVVRLPESARGKVSIGEISVLFERVMAPVRATPPQLPMAVRSSLRNSVDWLFTAFVLGSFLTHFGLVVYLENADHPVEDVVERIRTAQLLIDEPPEPPPFEPPIPPTVDDDGQVDPAPHTDGTSQQHQDPKHASHSEQSASSDSDVATLAAEAMRQAENLMLGSASLNGSGAFVDLLRQGAVTTDADALFALVNGSSAATHSSASLIHMHQVADGERTQGLGSLVPGKLGAGPVADGDVLHEAAVRGHIDPGEAEDEGGTGELDATEVTREIKKRLGAIRACYEHALRRDAGLEGKLVVSFTVEQSGSLSHVAVRESSMQDAGLSQCVASSIGSIRMRNGPRGGSVDFSYPFVFKGEH